MNSKIRKKSLNHENAYANIPCNFREGAISRLGVAYLTHAIRDTRYIATSIIVRFVIKMEQYNWFIRKYSFYQRNQYLSVCTRWEC